MCAIRYAYDASELLSVPVSHVNNFGGERERGTGRERGDVCAKNEPLHAFISQFPTAGATLEAGVYRGISCEKLGFGGPEKPRNAMRNISRQPQNKVTMRKIKPSSTSLRR